MHLGTGAADEHEPCQREGVDAFEPAGGRKVATSTSTSHEHELRMMERSEVMAKAAAWMQARGWKHALIEMTPHD